MSLKSSKELEKNVYELCVSASAEEFEAAVNQAYSKKKNKISVPGFRKGKATRKMIESVYGEGVFYEDALDIIYPKVVGEAIDEFEKTVVSAPSDVDIKSIGKDGLEMTMKVTVKPEVKIGEYKGLPLKKKASRVSEKEVNEAIEALRERNSRMVPVENRAVKDGDVVELDFEGFVDGVAFEGGKGENYELTIGSGQFIPGFEDQIIGKEVETDFDVNVTFPKEYGAEDLAGKDAVFKCKVHAIKEKELPELDDEFVKDVSEFDTLDELKADEKAKIKKQKDDSNENDFENAVIDKLIEGLEADIPQVMIDSRVDENLRDFDSRLQMQGLDLKTYLQYTGSDIEKLRESFKEQSERQVKIRLVLEKIVELEKIEVTETEVDEEIAKLAESYGIEADVVKNSIPAAEIKDDIAVQKAMDFVKANVKGK